MLTRKFRRAATLALVAAAPLFSQHVKVSDESIRSAGEPHAALKLGAAGLWNRSPDRIVILGEPRVDSSSQRIAFKAIDSVTGEVRGFVANGDEVSAVESPTHMAPASVISPLLAARLVAGEPTRHTVNVWLYVEDPVDERRQIQAAIGAGGDAASLRADARARTAAATTVTVNAAASWLEAAGYVVKARSVVAPVLTIEATADQIAVMAQWSFICGLYPSIDYTRMSDSHTGTHLWDRVFDFGIDGGDVRVAVVDDGGIGQPIAVPPHNLNIGGIFNSGNLNPTDHATGVAGVIGSRSFAHPGYARGVSLYSANATSMNDVDIMNAMDWALSQNCDVVVMPFGADTFGFMAMLDRYVDYVSRFQFVTVIVSAGNLGGAGSQVTSPGLAYNALTIGNVDDAGTADWIDDSMNPASSFVNPVSQHSDREKPELAAVGTNVTTVQTTGAFTSQLGGTSLAAATVAGMSAALTQVAPDFRLWPEAARAVLMASAWHNVEGASRLSSRDGAGAVHGLAAERIADRQGFLFGILTNSSFNNNGLYTHSVHLKAGEKVRVVLAWDSRASANFAGDLLDADLDLRIYAGFNQSSGTILASSTSFDNSYEIVEYTPQVAGFYTFAVNPFRFDGSFEYFGLAWSKSGDANALEVHEDLPIAAGGDLSGFVVGNPLYRISPRDDVHPNATALLYASLGDSLGAPLADGRLLPGDFDALAQLSLDPNNAYFHNIFGPLDANGEFASYFVSIPDLSAYVGYELVFSAVTVAAGQPGGVAAIAPAKRVQLLSHASQLPIPDDGFATVNIGFTFPFYGNLYTQLSINANGNVTFGGGDTTANPNTSLFSNGLPRIAAFWDDLNRVQGGFIQFRKTADSFVVEWVDVPEFGGAPGRTTVRLTLRQNGAIEMEYLECSNQNGLVGITPGGGAMTQEIDFARGHYTVPVGQGVYESFLISTFPPKPFDLNGEVSPSGVARRTSLRFTPIITTGPTYRVTLDRL